MFLFSFIIGKKSGLYQAQVLTFFGQRTQPSPIGAGQERHMTGDRPMTPARIRVALVATLATFALPATALAEDGAWKVGSSYVIRFEKLDTSTPAGRATLLAQ